jgi:uncharacterized lipoprotein YajG
MRAAFILSILMLAGCSTPTTILRNPTTGQVVQCGGGMTGSVMLGVVGYAIEKSNDQNCVRNYTALGFEGR